MGGKIVLGLTFILTIISKCFGNDKILNEHVEDGIKFDYIIVGASANGLIAVRSILEGYNKNEDINILLLDKGKSYIEKEERKSAYIPGGNEEINILISEDGYLIRESKVEGGRTSYGNAPFIAENVYTGEYYNDLGLDLDLQKLQESYEYVKSVGDMIQPNIRTSWVVALERAFNETRTFPVEDFNEELDSVNNLNQYNKVDKENVSDFVSDEPLNKDEILNKNSNDFLTSPHFVPYTFLTYGFRRGYNRRSSSRLTDINSKFMHQKKLYRVYNFNVKRILFLEKKDNENDFFAECIQGHKINEEDKLIKYCVKMEKGKIILSAGAINTPMILQRSGIGSIKDIKKSNPSLEKPLVENNNVGKGLKDHPTLSVFGFFKGLNFNKAHIGSSEALFSKKYFGTKCKDIMERDDIIDGCESITISEFEGFDVYQLWQGNSSSTKVQEEFNKNIKLVKDECLSLIRGVSIHIPNPYSEGEVVWDEEQKKPRIKLGLLEDINDLLIMEAGFRRIVRLFRSSNLSSLLIPNMKSLGYINGYERKIWNPRNMNSNYLLNFMHNSNYTRYGDIKNVESIYEKCDLNVYIEKQVDSNVRKSLELGIRDEPKYLSKLFNIKDLEIKSSNRTTNRRLKLDETKVNNNTKYNYKEVWFNGNLKNDDNIPNEPSLWKSIPLLLPKLPTYPDKIREYLKKNVRSGNEFVGTTSLGLVVETQCFKVGGVKNLHILDEGILNKHTNSNPLGTTMILSRYAIMNIMLNEC